MATHESRLGSFITALGADIKKMVRTDAAQTITGVKTFPPNALLMQNAGGTVTAEPYSDVNAPQTLMMTKQGGTAPPQPPTGQIVLYSPDGTTLLWKDDTNTVRSVTDAGGGGGAGTKNSALPVATSLAGSDMMYVVQGGVSKQIAASAVIPVPWVEVPLIIGTTAALTPVAASAAAGAELFAAAKSTRNKLDLSWATEVRLVGMVLANGNVAGVNWVLQYATGEASTWASSTGVATTGASLVLGVGTAGILRDSGWVSLAAGARIDNCYLAMVNGTTAQGTTAPTVGSLSMFFR